MPANIRFTEKADSDLSSIADFSFEAFGATQTRKYLQSLHNAIEMLATFPKMGAARENIAPCLRMVVQGSHAIYYSEQTDGILVERLLGPGQDPAREFES
ncbi:MAG: type II toxin-antitoxin system RelE/ParE family toxin [Alphaproteobacteria bacterium]|nr:type II toxin-antitoxin system RelE/ParE family toxin [Alphaproteobacteria bacterium]